MERYCPRCGAPLDAFAVRCRCGEELPEARDAQSDPDRPHCARCGGALPLLTETCPACGARGFPALRARRSPKSFGPPTSPPSPPSAPTHGPDAGGA